MKKKFIAPAMLAGMWILAAIVLAGDKVITVPLSYPADVTNYIWSVQYSSDMRRWTTICSNRVGMPLGFISMTNNNAKMFFRPVKQTNWL